MDRKTKLRYNQLTAISIGFMVVIIIAFQSKNLTLGLVLSGVWLAVLIPANIILYRQRHRGAEKR